MRVVDFIALMDPEVTPQETKVHLATWNGTDDPLDVYRAGNFDEWQRWQTRRNFERRFVVALIGLPGIDRWLYAGVYDSEGCEWHGDREAHYYQLRERQSCAEFSGRLVVGFERPGRQSYLNLDNWADHLNVSEILPERLSIERFPGFKAVDLSKLNLEVIVKHEPESWRTALSNVAGVYLISDTASGKLYVGSACGEGGIWQRWSAYVATGHGGNVERRQLLQDEGGNERANASRFSILEIADVHATPNDILRRESHWKKVLLSREHGLNSN